MLDLIKKLISTYNYSVKPLHPYGIFSFVKATGIKIEEKVTPEIFLNILNSLTQEFGNPIFVHSYYGFIFERDKKFIAYNIIEEYYGYDSIKIILFKKIPLGKKIDFNTYIAVENSLKNFVEKIGLDYSRINHYSDNRFLYLVNNDKFQLLLIIKKNELLYYISKLVPETIGMRVIPHNNCKITIDWNDAASLKQGLNTIIDKLKTL